MKLFRYLLAAVLALAPITPAPAGWLPIADSFSNPVSQACSAVSGTVITFTAQGTGTTNPKRISVVSINWSDSTAAGTAQLTSMTIGGIQMTKAVANTAGATNSNAEIWYASNPSGSTANIVANFATAVDGVTIGVYSLIGYQSVLATTTGTTSVSQGYNNKQLALAAASRTVNVSTSLSNLNNDFSSACGSNLWGVHASAALHGNSQTLNSSISPTTNNPKIALSIWQTDPAPAPNNLLTGLIGWWDTSVTASLTLNSTTITKIADQSGLGNDLGDGVTTLNRPTYNSTGLNSRPTMVCASPQAIGANFAMGTGNTLTFFWVGTMNSGAGSNSRAISYYSGVASDFSTAGSWILIRNGGTSAFGQMRFSAVVTQTVSLDTPVVIVGTIDSSGVMTLYLNGSASSTTVSGGNWVSSPGFLDICNSISDGTSPTFVGTASEWGIATGFSNSTTVTSLTNSLKTKWGIP